MRQCDLCDNPAQLQCYYCVDCGKICRTDNCGMPAARDGICAEHWEKQSKDMDDVMDWTDTAYYAGEFDKVNERLKELDISHISSTMIVCWLSSTWFVAKKLPYRKEFFKKCYDRLVQLRGEEIAKKLTRYRGLEEEIDELVKGLE